MSDMLLVRANETDLERAIAEEGVPIAPLLASSSFCAHRVRQARDALAAARFPFAYPFNPRLRGADSRTIVVFDSSCTHEFLRWLVRNNPDARVVLWYWNPVPSRLDPRRLRADASLARLELWSYSPQDCARFALRQNSTFYVEQAFVGIAPPPGVGASTPGAGAVFVGRDKGRFALLERLAARFADAGCPLDLHVVADRPRNHRADARYRDEVPYRQLLAREAASAAIVDVYADAHAGFSLRVPEALRLGKKLVSNNRNLATASFYHPSRIFVFDDEPDPAALRVFLAAPYHPMSGEELCFFELRSWLGRFAEHPAIPVPSEAVDGRA